MDALPPERVQVNRQGGDERFPFAGLHLGDLAVMQHRAADQLHVEVPHVDRTPGRLAAQGEGLYLQIVQGFTAGQTLPELLGPGRKVRLRELLHLGLEAVHALDQRTDPLQLSFVPGSDDLPENRSQQFHEGLVHFLKAAFKAFSLHEKHARSPNRLILRGYEIGVKQRRASAPADSFCGVKQPVNVGSRLSVESRKC